MSQLFLFTGENSFALWEERSRWVSEFVQKHGDENCARLEGKKLNLKDLLDEAALAPFIAEKRLILISGIPGLSKEEYELLLKGVHPDVILLIVDSKPDKRLSATKFLLKEASVKEFPTLSRAKLLQWMKSFFLQHGSDVDPKALETLIGIVGEDQMQISKELEKLALFAADRKCTKEDVEILALPTSEQVEWRLMELLGRGEVKEALSYVQHLLERGENPYALWNRLLWMVASLVLVSSAVQEGNRNPGEVSKVTGLNFGTVRTLFPIAQQVSQEKLSQIVSFMADSDRALKTGGYRSTVEAPQELCAVIDRCMLKLGALK